MEEQESLRFEIPRVKEKPKLQFQQEEKPHQHHDSGNEPVLRFLDSMDTYLTLFDSLSNSLRQGWLELASARHSMGASRINTALLDLQPHPASTSLLLTQYDDVSNVDSMEKQPHFVLHKWGSFDNGNCCSGNEIFDEDIKLQGKSGSSPQLRRRGNRQLSGEETSADGALLKVDDMVQKERSKSLSMFGTLVSPKLRSAQSSFETALEMLVEIANMRSAMLSSFDRVHKELEVTKRMG